LRREASSDKGTFEARVFSTPLTARQLEAWREERSAVVFLLETTGHRREPGSTQFLEREEGGIGEEEGKGGMGDGEGKKPESSRLS